MKEDIAIIGLSGRFAQARDLAAFHQNLKTGKDATRPVSVERIKQTTIDPDAAYQPYCYLDDIDQFDHTFFKLSRDEAEKMDPHQRLSLEEAYKVLESSGYPVSEFWNSKTAVFMSDANLQYYQLAEQFSPVLFTGNLNAALPSRISRFFNLRGPAMTVDTACSSSLVALHLACRELLGKESDLALVLGASLILFPTRQNSEIDIGIASTNGRTCSFSADAGGSGSGEAVVGLLLKRRSEAERDGDLIYALIKGSALNQDAQLSGSLTAPSSKAQMEVLLKAWENAGVDPRTISSIEAHGSATQLGDPIEIEGLNLAFRHHTDDDRFCTVTSVKANIGHTGGVAGLSGLTKAVLSLQHRELFPSCNYTAPNPFIDFEKSAVYVNEQLRDWDVPAGSLRRTGVSSFGLSGTNCHVVLEEASADQTVGSPPDTYWGQTADRFLFVISAKSGFSLQQNKQELVEFLNNNPELDPMRLSYALACSREHYSHRFACIAGSIAELQEKLVAEPTPEQQSYQRKAFKKLICVFDDKIGFEQADIEQFADSSPDFKRHFQECRQLIGTRQATTEFYAFACQYAIYRTFDAINITSKVLLGLGVGDLIAQAIMGEISLEEAVRKAVNFRAQSADDIGTRLQKLIKEQVHQPTLFFNFGNGTFASGLEQFQDHRDHLAYRQIKIERLDGVSRQDVVKQCYLSAYPIPWKALFQKEKFKKLRLPSYQFDRTRCWLRPPLEIVPGELKKTTQSTAKQPDRIKPVSRETANGAAYPASLPENWTQTEKQIALIWYDLLKLDQPLSLEDDFFELGGQSLYAIQMMNRIQQDFGVQIGFRNSFQWSTIRELAEQVDALTANGGGDRLPQIMPLPDQTYYDLSHNQARLWFLDQLNEEKFNYLISVWKEIEGKLNVDALAAAFETMMRRHEVLRTIFVNVNGEPKQKILTYEACGFKLEYTDLRNFDAKERDRRLREMINREALLPIDLETGPLLRVKVIRLDEEQFFYIRSIHHIVCDGWSLDLMDNELLVLYNHYTNGLDNPLPPLRIQYKDYAAWNNQLLSPKRIARYQTYWLDHLSGQLPESEFPMDFKRPDRKTWQGENWSRYLDRSFSEKVRQLGLQHKASMFMVVFAAIKALYFRYTLQNDIIFGTTISARNNAELEEQLGFYTSTLPIRTVFPEEASFVDLLYQVRQSLLGAFDHQWYPFDRLVKDLKVKRSKNRYPLFNILVALRNTDSILKQERADLQWANRDHGLNKIASFNDEQFHISKYDFTIRVAKEPDDRINLYFEYNTTLYRRQSMQMLEKRLLKILEAVIENPQLKLKDIPLDNRNTTIPAIPKDARELFNNTF